MSSLLFFIFFYLVTFFLLFLIFCHYFSLTKEFTASFWPSILFLLPTYLHFLVFPYSLLHFLSLSSIRCCYVIFPPDDHCSEVFSHGGVAATFPFILLCRQIRSSCSILSATLFLLPPSSPVSASRFSCFVCLLFPRVSPSLSSSVKLLMHFPRLLSLLFFCHFPLLPV